MVSFIFLMDNSSLEADENEVEDDDKKKK